MREAGCVALTDRPQGRGAGPVPANPVIFSSIDCVVQRCEVVGDGRDLQRKRDRAAGLHNKSSKPRCK